MTFLEGRLQAWKKIDGKLLNSGEWGLCTYGCNIGTQTNNNRLSSLSSTKKEFVSEEAERHKERTEDIGICAVWESNRKFNKALDVVQALKCLLVEYNLENTVELSNFRL